MTDARYDDLDWTPDQGDECTDAPLGSEGREGRGEAEAREPEADQRRGRAPDEDLAEALPRRRRRTRQRVLADDRGRHVRFTVRERLILLDTWMRSGLPAKDFSGLVGVSQHTLYKWKKRFEESGPAGLEDQPKGPKRGSRLPDATRRAILLMKRAHRSRNVRSVNRPKPTRTSKAHERRAS